MTFDMSQFFQVFFEEAEEHLEEMERLLITLDLAAPDNEDLNAIFRAAHSIKGGSGTFGFNDIAEVTHVLESLLDRARRHEIVLTSPMIDAFLRAKDVLRDLLAGHRDGAEVDQTQVAQVCATLDALAKGPAVGATAAAAAPVPARAAPPAAPVAVRDDGDPADPADAVLRVLLKGTVNDAALNALLYELRLKGAVDLSRRPEGVELVCTGQHARGEVVDMCGFVVGPSMVEILEPPPASPAPRPTGADAARVASDGTSGEGWGLFEPLDAGSDPASAALEGDGWGLFAPVEAAPQATATFEEGPGYGLFVDPATAREDKGAQPAGDKHAGDPPARTPPQNRRESDRAGPVDASIRVSVDKVDQLINLVGELVITQSMLAQTASGMDQALHEKLMAGLSALERNTRDLQESVMSIRMMPIASVFSRFPRLVRDLAQQLGKEVDLVTEGESTELDKGLIEKVADPLTHLVRNSMDHGIETPDKRVQAGKSPRGTITLRAYHRGGNIVIEVADNGGGLNRERILAKARERGMSVSDAMPDHEVFALIFEAGFSTAENVTAISGRGVGMDVVKRNITALGGRVEIESVQGIGTQISIRLPLTLAILDGMSVAVGRETFIVPLNSVVESLQPQPGDFRTIAARGRVLQVREEYLPVMALHDLFGIAPAKPGLEEGIMLVLESDGRKVALRVDELTGQQQVVIKSLETNYRRVGGVSGATIMGDGRVALILDVAAMVRMSQGASFPVAA
jgi:two-component system, chemotaxis family, sensor kinase CheA